MAYETGTFTSSIDLLQKLAAFCEANGWTRDRNASMGTGWAWVGHRDGIYVGLRAAYNESAMGSGGFGRSWSMATAAYSICVAMGYGYNSGASAWKWMIIGGAYASDDSTGATYGVVGGAMAALPSGAGVSYDFFSHDGGKHIVAVAEKTAGVFAHLGFGTEMIKYGTWSGGPYYFGSTASYIWNAGTAHYPNTSGGGKSAGAPGIMISTAYNLYFRCDADGSERWFGSSGNLTDTATNGGTGNKAFTEVYDADEDDMTVQNILPLGKTLYFASGSAAFGLQLLCPVVLHVKRGATSTYSPVGELPFVFMTRKNNVANRGTITYGGDTYMFYPKFAVKKES